MMMCDEVPVSKVNIKSLYVGNHWDIYSDEFKITNSTYTDVCVRGIGLKNDTVNDVFTSSEIEDTHFMVVSGDMDHDESVRSVLTFAKKFKSLNKDGVLIAVMRYKQTNDDSCNGFKEIFDHIVFIEDNDFLSSPLKIIASAFQDGFMPVDFLDLRALFKKHERSALSVASCKDACDTNEFLDRSIALIKKRCDAMKFNTQGMLVSLAIDGEKGHLGIAETVFSAFEKIMDTTDRDFIPVGRFDAQEPILELSVLAMGNHTVYYKDRVGINHRSALLDHIKELADIVCKDNYDEVLLPHPRKKYCHADSHIQCILKSENAKTVTEKRICRCWNYYNKSCHKEKCDECEFEFKRTNIGDIRILDYEVPTEFSMDHLGGIDWLLDDAGVTLATEVKPPNSNETIVRMIAEILTYTIDSSYVPAICFFKTTFKGAMSKQCEDYLKIKDSSDFISIQEKTGLRVLYITFDDRTFLIHDAEKEPIK